MSKRLQIPNLGEWYEDLLRVDSLINGRSMPVQGQSLLCAKLQEREENIRKRVTYLAAKRGISHDEMWRQMVSGEYVQISKEEIDELRD
jgi:hypothetical protein